MSRSKADVSQNSKKTLLQTDGIPKAPQQRVKESAVGGLFCVISHLSINFITFALLWEVDDECCLSPKASGISPCVPQIDHPFVNTTENLGSYHAKRNIPICRKLSHELRFPLLLFVWNLYARRNYWACLFCRQRVRE